MKGKSDICSWCFENRPVAFYVNRVFVNEIVDVEMGTSGENRWEQQVIFCSARCKDAYLYGP